MPKVEKLYVERGVSVEVAEGLWRRQAYGITVDVSEDIEGFHQDAINKFCDQVKDDLDKKIDEWLTVGTVHKHAEEVPKELRSELNNIPKIDPAELDDLPWNSYAKGPGQWIKNPVEFRDADASQPVMELVKALKKVENDKLTVGAWDYKFSGKDKKTGEAKPLFICRFPAKKEA